jgi:hypothetical protein
MSAIKRALEEIMFCEFCEGQGYSGFLSNDGEHFDFEWCACNPHHLNISGE